ncbi:hypothetical protein [Luteimicrobium sp. DT211]|uniref:hypothetical protein n=1 Tax=Luteimicrobium sp. DT211 TaxID=3393412 RepID=UPI003CEC7719
MVITLLTAFAATAVPSAAIADSPAPPESHSYLLEGAPLPESATEADIASMEAAGELTVLDASDGAAIQPLSSTPDGFKLWNKGQRKSDYVYYSDWYPFTVADCAENGTDCHTEARVDFQLKQTAIGGSSHAWELTLSSKTVSNVGGVTATKTSRYWCGVNVSGGSDTICDSSGAAPSGVDMSVDTLVKKPWGSKNSITVFPMVKAQIIFYYGSQRFLGDFGFRGYDTLSRASTTKLASSSGTGN